MAPEAETEDQREQRISDMQERAGQEDARPQQVAFFATCLSADEIARLATMQPGMIVRAAAQPIWPETILVDKTLDFRFTKREVDGRVLRILQQKVIVRRQENGGESMFDEWRDVEEES